MTTHHRLPTRALLADAGLALLLVVIGVVGTAAADQWGSIVQRPADAWAYALIVGAGTALVGRRRWPLVTLAVTTLLVSGYLIVGYPYGPILGSFFVAVYSAARHRPPSQTLPVAAVALVVLLLHLFTNDAALPGALGLAPASAWVIVPYAIGVTVRVTREASERARAEAVRERLRDERLRVAQEVHDVVGHGLAAIQMQADVALHLLPTKPEQAEVALTTISRTSGEALDELRATLAVVRREEGDATRAPTPSLARLEDLRQRMGDAGVAVDITVTGTPRPLPDALDLAGYRIVQEALTNVLRHSGAREASVTVAYDPDAVRLVVSNRIDGPPNPGGGLGIPGMRQRVTALGGELWTGARDGRFEVRARLPTEERS